MRGTQAHATPAPPEGSAQSTEKRRLVRNSSLHDLLESFTADAAGQLSAETASGAEIPFDLISMGTGGRSAPLYCYRPLTGAFIRERQGMLSALPTYAPAMRALAAMEGVEAYLRQAGESRIPADDRDRADAALRVFLAAVFSERSEFGFDPVRFEFSYGELERALYEGRCVSIVVAPMHGVALDHATKELPLGDGLSLVQGKALPDAPPDAVWGAHGGDGDDPNVLAVLTVAQERSVRPPVSIARSRFRRVLTALRLFERGGYALGPMAWSRTDGGEWRAVALGSSGRARFMTLISPQREDELRAFCNLVSKRMPSGGEVAWALSRFEMGCERIAPFEALTDYLLALRALLEPEGPASGRLAQRLAVICGQESERAVLAERIAHAISLERAVIAGLAPGETDSGRPADALVDELAEHLRALLRDVLCGHLDADLCAVADELLASAATV